MSRRVIARSLIALLALGAFASVAPAEPALAATETKVEVEGTNWFWRSQDRRTLSDVTGGCPPGFPAPCPDPILGLPNPHEVGALPVMVINGEVEKISAIDFDTEFLAETSGADVDRFVFTVVESPDARDRAQTFNATDRKIRACLVEDIWPTSEDGADEMQYAPPYDCEQGADGVRKEGETPADPIRWEFDFSEAAAAWGEDPFSAFGVMLVPVVEGSGILETWQIVLKGPRRDSAQTPTIDEAEPNKNNIQANMSYTPNPEEDDDDGLDTGGDLGGSDFDTGVDTGTDTGGDTGADTGGGDGGDEPADTGGDDTGEPASETADPGSAWYVWLLLPAALVGIGMVRAAVLEPVTGRREGGVVAMIRQQNAARRGWAAVPDEVGPSRLFAPFAALFAAVRHDLTNARSKLGRKTR